MKSSITIQRATVLSFDIQQEYVKYFLQLWEEHYQRVPFLKNAVLSIPNESGHMEVRIYKLSDVQTAKDFISFCSKTAVEQYDAAREFSITEDF